MLVVGYIVPTCDGSGERRMLSCYSHQRHFVQPRRANFFALPQVSGSRNVCKWAPSIDNIIFTKQSLIG
jgi:hypothetical protein